MHKKLKIYIILTLLIVIFFYAVNKSAIAVSTDNNNVHLVLDSSASKDDFLKRFRKTTDLTSIKNKKDLNINGLDKLNISGSYQFSEYNLPLLIKAIGTNMIITIVDLRQESYGFINFLNQFYKYCKVNGESFNEKWSEWKKAADANGTAAFNFSIFLRSNATHYSIDYSLLCYCICRSVK